MERRGMAVKKSCERMVKSLGEEVQRGGKPEADWGELEVHDGVRVQAHPRNFLISAQFLHKELAIQIARRVLDLDSLPCGLSHKPSVLKTRIKKIMQADEDVGKMALAVPVLVSKALELFLQDLCDRTCEITLQRGVKTMRALHLTLKIMTT